MHIDLRAAWFGADGQQGIQLLVQEQFVDRPWQGGDAFRRRAQLVEGADPGRNEPAVHFGLAGTVILGGKCRVVPCAERFDHGAIRTDEVEEPQNLRTFIPGKGFEHGLNRRIADTPVVAAQDLRSAHADR